MNDAIEAIPTRTQFVEQLFDFSVAGDVTRKHELAAKFEREIEHAVLDALTLVGKGESCALTLHHLGDAIGDRAIAEHSGD
jgi:hypothetical protein